MFSVKRLRRNRPTCPKSKNIYPRIHFSLIDLRFPNSLHLTLISIAFLRIKIVENPCTFITDFLLHFPFICKYSITLKFYVFLDVRRRRIIDRYIRLLGYPCSPARLYCLFCWTLKRRSLFASLHRVIFEKAKSFGSTSLSVCFKYCKVWHFQFSGSSVHSTNKVLTEC